MAARTQQQVVEELARSMDLAFAEGRDAMRDATDLARQKLEETAPHGRSGRLGKNVGVTIRTTQTGISATVKPREHYAGLVEAGSGLYVEHHQRITPKAGRPGRGGRKAALRLGGGGGSVVTFRRSVRGQRPRRFVQRAKDEVRAPVEQRMVEGAQRAAGKL